MSAPGGGPSLDRRAVLTGSAGLLIGCAWRRGPASPPFAPNAFVRVATDNTVTFICKYLEMGQGTYTGVATLLAEELDAAWDQVRVESAPIDAALYTNAIVGVQGTGASASMADGWTELRRAGAMARAMLVAAAAERWKTPSTEITVDEGWVIHHASRRRARFGELAARAARQPPPSTLILKDPGAYRLVGSSPRKVDAAAKSMGAARYALDIQLPGQHVAVIRRPPRFGGRVRSFDAAAARAVPGVVDVVQVPTGVAVIARTFPAARAGREALEVVWDDSAAERRGSADLLAAYRRLALTKGLLVRATGDAPAALARAAKVVVSTADLPYLAHAPMAPMDCVVRLGDGACEVWVGSQLPGVDHRNVVAATGLPPERVKLHVLFAGGSFGRRTSGSSDYVVEAVEIAKARPHLSPIKLQWTREDDIGHGPYRPLFHHRIEGGLDAKGALIGWRHRIVGQPLFRREPVDYTSVEGALGLPYETEILVELHPTEAGVPVMPWRSVGNTHNAFAIETAMDEFAQAAGRDPVAFRRGLLTRQPRLRGVLDLAAEKAGWGQAPGPGRGRGVALHKLEGTADRKGPYGSYVAQVAEVRVVDGEVRVERVVCAIDCGLAINPNVIRDQMEGSIAMGVETALSAGITLKDGLVEQSNFDGYKVLRMAQMPQVEVHIVPSEAPPTGVGEPGIPPAAPAVVNAVAAATGRRIRALPIGDQLRDPA